MRRRVLRSPIFSPSSHASPEVGLSRPSSSLTEVVLPAPLGPRNPKTSPRGTVIESPARATVCPNRLERFSVWMAGEPAAAPFGAAAAVSSITSVTSAGYNACSGQMVSDVDGVIALDGADHSINDSVLDPDHARADAGVVAQRQALDSLDRHSRRRGELHWDWDRQCRAGIADGLDRGFQLWRDAGLRQQVVLELHDGHLRRRGDWRGRFADDHLWKPRLGDV